MADANGSLLAGGDVSSSLLLQQHRTVSYMSKSREQQNLGQRNKNIWKNGIKFVLIKKLIKKFLFTDYWQICLVHHKERFTNWL